MRLGSLAAGVTLLELVGRDLVGDRTTELGRGSVLFDVVDVSARDVDGLSDTCVGPWSIALDDTELIGVNVARLHDVDGFGDASIGLGLVAATGIGAGATLVAADIVLVDAVVSALSWSCLGRRKRT